MTTRCHCLQWVCCLVSLNPSISPDLYLEDKTSCKLATFQVCVDTKQTLALSLWKKCDPISVFGMWKTGIGSWHSFAWNNLINYSTDSGRQRIKSFILKDRRISCCTVYCYLTCSPLDKTLFHNTGPVHPLWLPNSVRSVYEAKVISALYTGTSYIVRLINIWLGIRQFPTRIDS
jgi:hypothetical protein